MQTAVETKLSIWQHRVPLPSAFFRNTPQQNPVWSRANYKKPRQGLCCTCGVPTRPQSHPTVAQWHSLHEADFVVTPLQRLGCTIASRAVAKATPRSALSCHQCPTGVPSSAPVHRSHSTSLQWGGGDPAMLVWPLTAHLHHKSPILANLGDLPTPPARGVNGFSLPRSSCHFD